MIRNTFSYNNHNFSSGQDNALVLSFYNNGYKTIAFCPSSKSIDRIDEYSFDQLPVKEFEPEHISNIFGEHFQPASGFSSVMVIHQTDAFTIIPDELYHSGTKEELLDFVDKNIHSGSEVCSEDLHVFSEKFHLLYRILKWQNDLVPKININKLPDILAFTNAVLSNPNCAEGTYVNVFSDYFDTFILKNKQLLFINRFRYSDSGEFCYYLIGSMKSSGLTPGNETIYITGDILADSEIIRLLNRYVYDTHFLIPAGYGHSEDLHLHRYFIQLSVAL